MVNERYEARIVIDENGKEVKLCALEYCDRPKYAIGLCHTHYGQHKRQVALNPINSWRQGQIDECIYDGCHRPAMSRKATLCTGHLQQLARGQELAPIRKANAGASEDGRVCRDCKAFKPWDQYYDRNGHKGGPRCKATQCKTCFMRDVKYYKGECETKANGTDPKGYNGVVQPRTPHRVAPVRMLTAKLDLECVKCKTLIPLGRKYVVSHSQNLHLTCFDEQ